MASAAQETFMEMLRTQVAPTLQAHGLKGSGREYSIPSMSHWATIGFQGSTAHSALRMRFTVNCKVVRKDVWATMLEEQPWIGQRPKPNTRAGFEWDRRIGHLLPQGKDTWWWVDANG